MIELAPNSKSGLSLTSPIMIASGCCGYGQTYHLLIDLSLVGAIVTQPVTLRPRSGPTRARLAETQNGLILNTGQQNPGVKKVLHRYTKVWSRIETPIIVHLPADEPNDLRRTARALAGAVTPQGHPALAAIELGIPHSAQPYDIEHWIKAIQQGCELPLLAKLPLGISRDNALAAANSYVDGFVVGTPPLAAAYSAAQELVTGPLYSTILPNLVLYNLQAIASFGLPVVATGGIHSLADVTMLLDAGAAAVQIDTLLFIDPKQVETIARAFLADSDRDI